MFRKDLAVGAMLGLRRGDEKEPTLRVSGRRALLQWEQQMRGSEVGTSVAFYINSIKAGVAWY